MASRDGRAARDRTRRFMMRADASLQEKANGKERNPLKLRVQSERSVQSLLQRSGVELG
jgi:hypothetical protein